ncbi:MAG: signal peptidase II [Candidatus Binatia bacterium]
MSKGSFVLAVATGVVVLDQLTKWWVRRELPLHDAIPVIPGFFAITHAANPGGAFSLLAGLSSEYRVPFFLITSAVAIVALLYFLRQVASDQRWLLFALAGVLGGAVGNLIDRIALGTVTDFLLVYYRSWSWPAFNVADSFITIGVLILVAHSIFAEQREQPARRVETR